MYVYNYICGNKLIKAPIEYRPFTRPKIPKNPKILNFVLKCPKMTKLSKNS